MQAESNAPTPPHKSTFARTNSARNTCVSEWEGLTSPHAHDFDRPRPHWFRRARGAFPRGARSARGAPRPCGPRAAPRRCGGRGRGDRNHGIGTMDRPSPSSPPPRAARLRSHRGERLRDRPRAPCGARGGIPRAPCGACPVPRPGAARGAACVRHAVRVPRIVRGTVRPARSAALRTRSAPLKPPIRPRFGGFRILSPPSNLAESLTIPATARGRPPPRGQPPPLYRPPPPGRRGGAPIFPPPARGAPHLPRGALLRGRCYLPRPAWCGRVLAPSPRDYGPIGIFRPPSGARPPPVRGAIRPRSAPGPGHAVRPSAAAFSRDPRQCPAFAFKRAGGRGGTMVH